MNIVFLRTCRPNYLDGMKKSGGYSAQNAEIRAVKTGRDFSENVYLTKTTATAVECCEYNGKTAMVTDHTVFFAKQIKLLNIGEQNSIINMINVPKSKKDD